MRKPTSVKDKLVTSQMYKHERTRQPFKAIKGIPAELEHGFSVFHKMHHTNQITKRQKHNG
jgi:hypothetical protein